MARTKARFPGKTRIIQNAVKRPENKGGIVVGAYPTKKDGERFEEKINHVSTRYPDTLAYLRMHPKGENLVVSIIKRDFRNGRLHAEMRRYGNYREALISAAENYAKENGFKQVLIAGAEHQKRASPNIPEHELASTYEKIPFKLGYSKQTLGEPVELESFTNRHFWIKKIK